MNRPPFPHMMQNMYRNPRPYSYQRRPSFGPNPRLPWRNQVPFKSMDNEEHWCETCDRGFASAELLTKHKQQHQKCNIDGCQFVAHPKVITKHIQMQHSTGLYKKIANLNNPEEIQKWREERKKKYPTKANIEKKVAEFEEKVKRGEKMALKHDRRNDMKYQSKDQRPTNKRKYSFDDKYHKSNKQNFRNGSANSTIINNNKPPPKKITKPTHCTPITVEKNKLKPFTGILNIDMGDEEDTAEMCDSNNILIEDDYEDPPQSPKETQNNQEPIVCSALTSLMCDYRTSDEEIEEKENENKQPAISKQKSVESVSIETTKVEPRLANELKINENDCNRSDDEGPEEVKIVKTNNEHNTTEAPVIKGRQKPIHIQKMNPSRNEQKNNYKSKHKVPSTLLQKLLYKEIRHERNIVLQCIRYIRENNYFDKPQQ